MRVVADQHLDRRGTEQPVGLYVPASPPQHRAARRCEAHKVSDRGAGNEADRCLARQVEQIEQPMHCHRFCSSGSR
jgi:hypothetical protein